MRLNLSIKIPALVVAAAMVAGLAVAVVDYRQTARELRGAAEAKLLALLEARAIAISDYLASIRRDLYSQAANPFVAEAQSSFLVGRSEFDADANEKLHALYVTGNPYQAGARHRLDHPNDASIYSLAHVRFHPQLRGFAQRYGYRDILLVDLEGNVVYSVMKQSDFATNLADGPYRHSGLARAAQAAAANAASGDAVFVDFAAYEPSGGEPTGFVATRIRGEGQGPLGILVFEMPVDRINRVMQVAAGLGETGETIIVGPDLLMRSDSRFAAEPTILKRRIDIGAMGRALAGESGIEVSGEMQADGQTKQVLVAYRPLDFLGVRWAVAAKADLDEVYAPVRDMRDRAVVNGIGIAFLVAVLGMAVTRFTVVGPLGEVMQALRALTAGNRDAPIRFDKRHDEIGDIGRALVLYRDGLLERDRLAEERRREVALVESARRFRAIAEAQPVPLVIFRAETGALVYENPAAVALLGIAEQESATLDGRRFFSNPAAWERLLSRGRSARGFEQFETRLVRSGGDAFPAALSGRAIEYDGAAGVVVGILDLTEREAAQAEIERQREMIYHREKLGALGSLLAGVAHELNNPLSIVVAQATLLEDLATDAQTATRGRKIRAAAERCARIVKTFLAMARQRPPARTAVNLNQAINAAMELLGYNLRTAGIETRLDLAAELPSVWADADQINQVVTNLIVNAQQAMENCDGPRRLSIRTGFDAVSDQISFALADSGPGVAPEIRSRIFEPFFTTKPVGMGTGVGLSVCHGIVSAYGGSIAVDDAPGGGAMFTVRLPAGSGMESEETSTQVERTDSMGMRLLVVDDEPEIAQSLAEILALGSYRVDIADGGEAALGRLKAADYDVILSDIRMPNMDGIALYRHLCDANPRLARNFIVVTGDTLSGAISSFLAETGLPCIEKPFNPVEINRLVASVLERRDVPGAA